MEFRDVTNEVAATAARHESDERYRTAFESAHDGILVWTPDRVIVDCNSALSRMLGYEAEELIGKAIRNLVHPDNRPWLRERRTRRLTGESVSTTYVLRLVRKDGQAVTVETSSSIRGSLGQSSVNMSTYRDVTARLATEQRHRNDEERFRVIFEDSLTPMALVLNADGERPLRNRAHAKMLGYSQDEFANMAHDAFVSPEDLGATRQRIKMWNDGGEPELHPFERHYVHQDGHVVNVKIQESSLNIGGEHADVLIMIRDVTAELVAQEALRESADRFRAVFEDSHVPMVTLDTNAERVSPYSFQSGT